VLLGVSSRVTRDEAAGGCAPESECSCGVWSVTSSAASIFTIADLQNDPSQRVTMTWQPAKGAVAAHNCPRVCTRGECVLGVVEHPCLDSIVASPVTELEDRPVAAVLDLWSPK